MVLSLSEESEDILIPQNIANKFNINHTIYKCNNKEINKDLEKMFVNHLKPTRFNSKDQLRHTDIKNLINLWPKNNIFITGAINEITKQHYGYKSKKITPEILAYLANMNGNTIAIELFNQWLSEYRKTITGSNFKLLDIFYWEQRSGKWEAMIQLEYDLVHETLSPFNCRSFLQ